jgi:hypothetical protein
MFRLFRAVYVTFSFFSCVVSYGLQSNVVQLTIEMNRPYEHIFEPQQRETTSRIFQQNVQTFSIAM